MIEIHEKQVKALENFVLSCCSTADISMEHLKNRDIQYICFHYFLDGKEDPDDLGQSVPFDEFYAAMSRGAETRTSQVNVAEYVEYFGKFLEEGRDILHISLSTGLSGSYNSACIAKSTLEEQYPDRKIYLVEIGRAHV